MSNKYKQLKELVEKHSISIKVYDPRFRNYVIVKETHGFSSRIIPSAFILFVKGYEEYYIVISEHEGDMVYHSDEYSCLMLKPCYDQIEEIVL